MTAFGSPVWTSLKRQLQKWRSPTMVLAVGFLLRRFILPRLPAVSLCLWRALTGIPCPLCGGTRSVVLLSRFEFQEALAMNPLVTVGIIGAILWLFVSPLLQQRARFVFPPAKGRGVGWVVLVLTLSNWVYLIVNDH